MQQGENNQFTIPGSEVSLSETPLFVETMNARLNIAHQAVDSAIDMEPSAPKVEYNLPQHHIRRSMDRVIGHRARIVGPQFMPYIGGHHPHA